MAKENPLLQTLESLSTAESELMQSASATEIEAANNAAGWVESMEALDADIQAADAVDTAIGDADQGLETLGETIEVVETTSEATDDPLNEPLMRAANITHESILRSLGMFDRLEQIRPTMTSTMESLKPDTDPGLAFALTMESMRESGSAIFAGLKQAFMYAIELGKSIVSKIIQMDAIVRTRMANARRKLASISPSAPMRSKILTAGGKMNVDGDANPATARKIMGSAITMVESAVTLSNALKGSEKFSQAHNDNMTQAMQTFAKSLGDRGNGRFGYLTNDRTISIEPAGTTSRLAITEYSSSDNVEITAPTIAEIDSLLREADNAYRRIRDMNKIVRNIEEDEQKTTRFFQEKLGGSGDYADDGMFGREFRRKLSSLTSIYSFLTGKVGAAAMDAVRGAVEYCDAGLNNFEQRA